MAIDLTAVNIKNKTTHLADTSVSRGIAHAVLFKRSGTSDVISLGIVDELTPVNDRETEDFKVPNTLNGGPEIVLFTEVQSVTRGEDFDTYTRDIDVLSLHAGSAPDTVKTAGTFTGSYIFDNGANGMSTGAAVRITSAGTGTKSLVVFRPNATLTGVGETTDANVSKLQFELRGSPSGVTWKLPAALEGNLVGKIYEWGVTLILDQEDVGPAVDLLLDSVGIPTPPAA